MPELPEVETICRGLRLHTVDKTVCEVRVHVAALRRRLCVDAIREACVGKRLAGIRRRGKNLVMDMADGATLVVHLGMTGAFRTCPAAVPPGRHECLGWDFSDGSSLRLADPRRFGSVMAGGACGPGAWPACLGELGLEPLSESFGGAVLWAMTRQRQRPIKNLLMDQTLLVGVGNIYASEALFRAGIHPARASARLSRRSCERLAAAVKTVLDEAIAAGGTTLSDFRALDGSEGKFQTCLRVYGRTDEPCQRCGLTKRIRRTVMAGRSTFHCPGCQH